MKAWLDKLQQLQWQKLDRLSVVVLAILILWLCWKLASFFWLVVAPPQMMQFDRVELGSQQPQIPNISTFSLFNEPSANAAQESVNLLLKLIILLSVIGLVKPLVLLLTNWQKFIGIMWCYVKEMAVPANLSLKVCQMVYINR